MDKFKNTITISVDERNVILGTCVEGIAVETDFCASSWVDENGVYIYKYTDGEIVERTREEIEADRAALPEPEESEEDLLLELMADHEERICMLEIMSDF